MKHFLYSTFRCLAFCCIAASVHCANVTNVADGGSGTNTGNARVNGIIYTPQGQPASSVLVKIFSRSFVDTLGINAAKVRSGDSLYTDAAGRFVLNVTQSGEYVLSARNAAHQALAIPVSVDQALAPVDVPADTLRNTGTIRGVVTVFPQGAGQRYAVVCGLEGRTPVDSQGGFTIENVPAGTFQVKIVSAGPLGFADSATASVRPDSVTILDTIIHRGMNYYVSASSGSDNASGSTAAPFKSVTRALAVAVPGDTLNLAEGTYGPVLIAQEGITLRSVGPAPAVIRALAGEQYAVCFGAQAAGCNLRNLEITGGDLATILFASTHDSANNTATEDYGARNSVVENCTIHDGPAYLIKLNPDCDTNTLLGCTLYNTQTAVQIANASATRIRACSIRNASAHGILVQGGARNCVIEGNIIRDIGVSGIAFGLETEYGSFNPLSDPQLYESVDGTARNNIIIRCQYAGIASRAAWNTHIYNNTIIESALTGQAGIYMASTTHADAPDPTRVVVNAGARVINNIIQVAAYGQPVVHLASDDSDCVFANNRYARSDNGAVVFWDERTVWTPLSFSQWSAAMGDSLSTAGDPGVDTTGHMLPGSACIDAGRPLDDVASDIDHQNRPQRAAWDIGADEAP